MDVLNQINFNPVAFFINMAGFLLLLYLLNKMLFKPVGALLDQRQQDIASTYDKLEADRRQMETLRADYERRLAGIEAEAREKIQGAIKEAQSSRDQILQEAGMRSKEMLTRAEEQIRREQEQAMITLRQEVVELALGATSKIIGDSLDENRQRRLIDEFITTSVSNGSGPGGSATAAAAALPPTAQA